uniref:Uncharacterized protein n=1 Tax=Arundo donax TaxID=35708 RepID=A0A0A9D0K3_ARUDO
MDCLLWPRNCRFVWLIMNDSVELSIVIFFEFLTSPYYVEHFRSLNFVSLKEKQKRKMTEPIYVHDSLFVAFTICHIQIMNTIY